MLIHRIEITNFKSFATAAIDMAPGLTAIVGDNGAGKTAILQAIGLGVFDARPRPLASVMRHGATDASVAIEFTSGLDERRYRVTRKLHRTRARGTGALSPQASMDSEIFDVEQRRVFEERADDVEAFLAQHLGVAGFTGPDEVFDRVVGVPQGRLTADFLDTPSLRRERFDPILRVDEFKRAVDDLRPLLNHFDKQRVAHESTANELAHRLEAQPAAEAALAEARREAHEIAQDRIAAQAKLDQAVAAAQRHDAEAQAADAALTAAKLADSQLLTLQQAARDAESQVAEAKRAADEVDETRADHEAYAAAQDEIKKLGDVSGERDVLRERLSSLQADETRAAVARDQARQTLAEAKAAAEGLGKLADAAAAETEAVVAVQELNGRLAVARATAESADRAQTQVAGARRDFADGYQRCAADVEAAGARVRQLEADWEAASALRPLVDQLDSRGQALRDLQTQRASVTAVMAADDEAAALLEQTKVCPFFDSECRNLADVPDVALVFEQRASSHQRHVEQLANGEATAQTALREAEDAQRRMGDLPARHDALEAAKSEHLAARAVLEGMHPVSTAAQGEDAKALNAAIDSAEAELPPEARPDHLIGMARRLVGALESLAESRQAAGDAARLNGQIQEAEQALQPHVGAGGRLVQAQALADEQDARAQAARQAVADAERAAAARAAADVTMRDLEPRLAEVQAAQRKLDESRAGHERYLQHERLASETEQRAERLQVVQAQVRDAVTTTADAWGLAARLGAAADRAARDEAHEARNAAIACKTELDTRAEAQDARIAERRKELDELAEVAGRLDAENRAVARAKALRERTELMRGVLRAAGPLVTEALLADVSEAADEIFGEVLGDRAGRLRWTPDYDIVLERGGHTRSFTQLSGGEQMTAALAVRLALLRELLHIDVAFFDEPTQNLDDTRRTNLAEQILHVRGFKQLVVITHDDSFERMLDHVIHVRKVNGESRVEVA
ncbi:MAG: SMC family ATPase [Chloroflexi bacterium]|nr:SMC family ATPase [Chloroflexota bacterium]